MTNNVQELEVILEAEADLMDALVEVMGEKQQAVIKLRGDLLAESTDREQQLMQLLHGLEEKRLACAADVAASLTPSGAVTLSELASRLEGPAHERVGALAARIRGRAETILAVNGRNKALLRHSMRFVQQTLSILTDEHRRSLIDERM